MTVPADETAIRGLVEELEEAWNRGDASAMARHFRLDGTFTNVLGVVHFGRAAFEARHHDILTTVFKESKAENTIRRVQFVRPDVALVDVDAELSGIKRLPPGIQAPPDGALRTRLLLVLVKDNGAWSIAAFHNVDVKQLAQP